jgi:IclR family transcriptional regulator, KDG regulon repressor
MVEIAQTADHALRILEELGRSGGSSPAELSERLGLTRTVVHRLLHTLNARGFVLRHGSVYRPGATLLWLAGSLEPALRAVAGPLLRALSEEAGETAVLHVADGVEVAVLVQSVATQHLVQVSHRVGARHPITLGASGRALLANLPEAVVERALAQTRQDAAARPEAEVRAELETIRTVGHARSHDELQSGVHGLAAPVLAADGFAVASVALLAPPDRAATLDEHLDQLLRAATRIGEGLRPEA